MSLGPSAPKVAAPDPKAVGGSFNALLDQLYQSAPGQFQQQATYQPAYTDLGLANLNTELTGPGPGGSGGLLAQYLNNVLPAASTAGTGANYNLAAGNVSNITSLGPSATAAINGVSPGTTSLLDNLTSTANKNLALGTQLDPGTVDTTLNEVNQNWSDRGLGGSPGNGMADALQLYAGGQNLLSTRENAAENAASTVYNTNTAPITNLLTPTSNAPSLATGLLGAGQNISSSAGPTMYQTSDLESLMNTVYNQQAGANIQNANLQAARDQGQEQFWSSIIGGAESGGGAAAGGGM